MPRGYTDFDCCTRVLGWVGNAALGDASEGYEFHKAVRGLTQALKEKRLQEASPLVVATVGDRTVQIYSVTLQRLQNFLAEQDYYQGASDGKFGLETQQAIEAYQRKESLPVTGLPDQLTLNRMLR